MFLALWIVNLIGPSLAGIGLSIALFFIFLGLKIWLGVKVNEMTAKNYLDNGWLFSDEGSDTARLAKINGVWQFKVS